MSSAAPIIIAHNHPMGDPTPSAADIKITRDFIRADQLLKIEVLDRSVMGHPGYNSLRPPLLCRVLNDDGSKGESSDFRRVAMF